MNYNTDKQHNEIIINARFLTHRITGLERYAVEISRQLKKLRPSLTFVAPKDIQHRSIAEELEVECFGVLRGHLWEQIELPLFLRRRNNPLMINPVNTGPMWYKNQITVIHDIAFLRNPKWFSRRGAMWFKFLVPRVMKSSSLIMTDTAFTKGEIIELMGFTADKIHVVYPGISDMFIESANRERKVSAGRTILTVSTLEPRKNLKKLIEGFKNAGIENSKLVIAGGMNPLVFGRGGEPDKNADDSSIVFLGYVTDAQLLELYNHADVFISASLYEGFGFPPLEAYACGCKVIVSDIPSHHEIFDDSVVYVDPVNTKDIAHKLKSVVELNNDRSESEAARILARFSWRRAAEELLNIAEDDFSC
ncbi:MAG: glycosyltransferase family 4 protein [Bacteroidetes bacterium]|nr:glycosyltransferase family 4 protein [Bacteroidota bacterium]